MPFTTAEITTAGKAAIDFYLKNNPIDQVASERPWMAKLMAGAKPFPGAKQYVTEQLRKSYDSNFQWYYGAQAVTYNAKDITEQAQFSWRGWHDGFYLDEDRLAQNGISVTDDAKGGTNTGAERVQLTNLLNEHVEALRLGAEEKFDYYLHGDGSTDTDSLEALHLLVDTTVSTGTVGGINQATATWWRNQTNLSIAAANLLSEMEETWRNCTRNGGRPDFIMAGATFIDTYRETIRSLGDYQLTVGGIPRMDGGVGMQTSGTDTGLYFKGVPIVWNPTFYTLATDNVWDDSSYDWEKRCYFINSKFIKLRPLAGHNMVTRKPPREYNRYVHYWGLTWKGAVTAGRRNCHAVLSVA